MNIHAIRVIYKYEMKRAFDTIGQSFASPILSTILYFVVFGSAIGSRIDSINGVSYGLFIVPGLMMLAILTQSLANASFGIFFPRFTGQIYEVLSAPISTFEIVLGYVGAAATKSLIIGVIILATANFFVDVQIAHPFWMVVFLL
ncbi:MAG: ABC transporter permease, partial [Gammaproteobacteria bacterium]|nr:ABC transporter permease [Gammaproteobacteria bacterium]